jgi:hypothetical protein
MTMREYPRGANVFLRAVRLTSSLAPKPTTTVNLLYRLPYTSTLLIYDDETKNYITKTFKPGDLSPQNDLVNINTTSKNYNVFRINDYINRGIFSSVTLASGSENTSGGTTSVDLNSLYLLTVNKLEASISSRTILRLSNGWISGSNILYYVSIFAIDDAHSSISLYDLNKNEKLYNIAISDVVGGSFTNPVVTSYGKIVCLANLGFWDAGDANGNNQVYHQTWAIGEVSSDTSTGLFPNMYFMVDDQTDAKNAIDISGLLDVSALLIDESDNLFAVASDGVYSIPFINNRYIATKIYNSKGNLHGGSYYDRLSKNICLAEDIDGSDFFTKITTSGTLVSQTQVFIDSQMASCGVMLDNYMVTDGGELIDMTDGTFESTIDIAYNNVINFLKFFDGPINQGRINDQFPIMCINYNTHTPNQTDANASYGEVYFFDYLGDRDIRT